MSRPTAALARLTVWRPRGHVGVVDVGLLGLAAAAFTAGAVSFASGVYCYTQPDPGTDCAVLIAILPLLFIPLGLTSAIFGAAHAGWLVRDEDEPTREGNAAAGHE